MKEYVSFGTLGFIVLIATLLLCAFYFFMFGVDALRWKQHDDGSIEWNRDSLSINVEGNSLIIKTQDDTWFIEMERKEE